MSTIERALSRKKKRERDQPHQERDGADDSGAMGPPNAPPTGAPPTSDRKDLIGVGFEPRGPLLKVDINQLRRQSMYPTVAMEDRIGNEYRRIKRPLLGNATGRGVMPVDRGNLIMVTSAIQGEGKTFTSLNLALSIARDPDFSVTLVDGDVARGHLTRVLGAQKHHGLLDLLADESLNPMDLIMPTNIESLSVLTAGSRHALSEELLSSERMGRLVSQLADPTPRHIILFDSPPVLAAPDAVTLSHHMGQVVVVVKSSSTLRHQVTTALDQLDPDKAINMVLNQALGGMGGDDYGGYYGYGDNEN
ncbi:hypothetical protein HC341_15875 [Aquisalimonas sp. 2447]|uniref:hypothetical protein n=1 Tax=Aquisalimonas sp. 2447 TaxID=2740807 RepID=UPI00143248C2|nr:hypothetical protein [Aquisalimonas sp. 2447]QIT56543.1 hypothetical protein HC341_15875 [Aquisalimonas sp. 2447]